jgi:DNA-binding LacI/PurR family transcriptional regulator
MANIGDVAKLAGVSKMTVSRVINNNGYVKNETRETINKVIEKLDFRPSMIAKSLVTKQSHILAHVMLNISDPYNSIVSKGMEDYCYQHGYVTMICDAYSKTRERDYFNMFIDRNINGAVIQQLAIDDKLISTLEQKGVKCILMDNEQDYPDVYCVNTNHYLGGMMAVDYLISKGHTRIGCIHGVLKRPEGSDIPYIDTFQHEVWRQRTKGYIDGMYKHGLSDTYLYQGNGLENLARKYVSKALDSMFHDNNRPTAVYCENDLMAIALLNVMKEQGLNAPDDLAIIGHDGLSLCRILHPYITTIAHPLYDMGYQAASMLIQRIQNQNTNIKLVLDPELIAGETA